jgi:hypothetical protein
MVLDFFSGFLGFLEFRYVLLDIAYSVLLVFLSVSLIDLLKLTLQERF